MDSLNVRVNFLVFIYRSQNSSLCDGGTPWLECGRDRFRTKERVWASGGYECYFNKQKKRKLILRYVMTCKRMLRRYNHILVVWSMCPRFSIFARWTLGYAPLSCHDSRKALNKSPTDKSMTQAGRVQILSNLRTLAPNDENATSSGNAIKKKENLEGSNAVSFRVTYSASLACGNPLIIWWTVRDFS